MVSGNVKQCSHYVKRKGILQKIKNITLYTYGWFMLMYGRNQYNIIEELSFN